MGFFYRKPIDIYYYKRSKNCGMAYDEEVINNIKDRLVEKEETLAVAESVTSGNLQAAFSLAMEASTFYQGGITVYNLGQKTRQLNVEPIHGQKVNSVSERVASELAIEVSKKFLSDYGIGITGYASIVPQCEAEGLFAFVAISYRQKVVLVKRITSGKQLIYDVQVDYTSQVINIMDEWVNKNVRKTTSLKG